MRYFACKLIPPRKTFLNDMSEPERDVMRQHVGYWTDLLNRGKVLLFGPVDDPDGGFGLGILALSDESDAAAEAIQICQADPVQLRNIGFSFTISPMPRIVHQLASAARA
ncbi:MAG TPA: YciI family protein [Candidatus Angelobacter sp.]|nr:YciI family protein [Candidatus Angelobacter sp.]